MSIYLSSRHFCTRWKLHGGTTTGSASNIRAFEEIPGPKSLPIVGTLHRYLPLIGDYSFKKLHKSGEKKYREFGPLIREEITPGLNTVLVYTPEDIAEVFKSEVGKYPERRSHLALLKYRDDRKDIYSTGGLLPTNGEKWWKLRKEFQKDLSKRQNIVNYIENIDKVMKVFVEICGRKRHEDLLPLLSRLFLELTCLVVFDESMNTFTDEEMRENSVSSRLIDAALTTNTAILGLDNGPRLWKYFNTSLYRKLCKSQRFMEEIAVDMVSRKMNAMKGSGGTDKPSLLEIYLRNENLNVKDVVGMACDMLLAGIDTTTYTTSFLLYHVSKSQRVQQKLYEEIRKLLPAAETSITSKTLTDATYVKAVIKETFRLNPISVGVGRILLSDVVLSGYKVPKGTIVVTQNQITCRLPQYFEDPEEFKPERWLRDNPESRNVHPYLVLPFGHGPRSCIARRLAEQNIQMFLLRICRTYDLEWRGGTLDSTSIPINKPDGPITVEFTLKKNSEELSCGN